MSKKIYRGEPGGTVKVVLPSGKIATLTTRGAAQPDRVRLGLWRLRTGRPGAEPAV